MKIFKILSLTLALYFIPTSIVSAEEICFPEYGGGEECIDVDEDSDLDVEKVIFDPKLGDYRDHIGSDQYTFDPSEEIRFKVTVKNTGEVTLREIEVKDTLPSFIDFESEVEGDAHVAGDVIRFDLDDLEPGGSEVFIFEAQVDEDSDLPTDDKICLTNIAEAVGEREDDRDKEEKDSDYANFCIDLPDILGKEKPTKLPKAGGGGVVALVGVVLTTIGTAYQRSLGKTN